MTTLTVGEGGVEVLLTVQPQALVSEGGVEVLLRVQPDLAISQAGVEYLYKSVPCASEWTQVWSLARLDGEVFRFTALDRDLDYLGEPYLSCGSMAPSAAESSDDADGVGSMELSGILGAAMAAGYITEADLYAGRFDGAYVEAWLVPFGDPGEDIPRRLLAGSFGKSEFGEASWKVELSGDGARLQQTPLLSVYTPGCRWKNGGGFGGPECQKDLVPLTVSGVVDAGGTRAFTDAARAEPAGYFSRGRVTFTSGANVGLSAEIRDHLAGGAFTLWPRLAADIAAGDAYDMKPGCTYATASDGGTNGCIAWANLINYGGYPDVPGRDALAETPDVK